MQSNHSTYCTVYTVHACLCNTENAFYSHIFEHFIIVVKVVLVDMKTEEIAMDEDSLYLAAPPHQPVDPLQSNNACEVCGKVYDTRKQYMNHMKYHRKVKDQKCDWPGCGKAFVSKSLLATHRE